jgi:anthranilate phosphoribosyltransferase
MLSPTQLSPTGSAPLPFSDALGAVIARRHLDARAMSGVVGALIDGCWTQVQGGGFLAALAGKGETIGELVGAALALRERAQRVVHDLPLVLDVCGTGGDRAGTINVSTGAAFVAAACGVPVAKHGNRAASSRCGSADVLEFLGIPLDLPPEAAARALARDRFAFLFAQHYHPAMKTVASLRRELGVRTIFNIVGPLANPAGATRQIVGVAKPEHVELVADALRALGTQAAAVFHSHSGLDEIAGEGPTSVYRFDRTGTWRYEVDPAKYGISAARETLAGGDVADNAAALVAILDGERSPRADVVALNAAMALQVAERAESLREGLALARNALQSGAARAVLELARAANDR